MTLKVGDKVPTKVKCIHTQKTILALRLSASAYLPRVQARIDELTLATQNGPATGPEAKAGQLFLCLQMLLLLELVSSFGTTIGLVEIFPMGRKPWHCWGPVCWSCLPVCTEWENVENITTLVCALLTWQRWHSRTPGCIRSEEYGEAMLTRLCAQCQV